MKVNVNVNSCGTCLTCAPGAGQHPEHLEHSRAGHRALQGQGPLQSSQHGGGEPGARRPHDQTRYGRQVATVHLYCLA